MLTMQLSALLTLHPFQKILELPPIFHFGGLRFPWFFIYLSLYLSDPISKTFLILEGGTHFPKMLLLLFNVLYPFSTSAACVCICPLHPSHRIWELCREQTGICKWNESFSSTTLIFRGSGLLCQSQSSAQQSVVFLSR